MSKSMTRLVLVVMVLFPSWAVMAQEQPEREKPGQEEQKTQEKESSPKTTGTVLTPAQRPTRKGRRTWEIRMLRLTQVYDSNLIRQGNSRIGSTYSVPQGEISFNRVRSKSEWQVSYRGGARIYPAFGELNTGSHDASIQWNQTFTPRLRMMASQRWASLPGGGFSDPNPDQDFPLLGANDDNALFLQQRRKVWESAFSLHYRTGRYSSLVLGANRSEDRFDGGQVTHSETYDAYASYTRQFSRGQNFGVSFDTQWLRYRSTFGNARVHNLLFNYGIRVGPSFTFTAFAGPAMIQQEGGSVSNTVSFFGIPLTVQQSLAGTRFNWVGGMQVAKDVGHTTLKLRYSRTVSRGSGFLPTVLRQSVSVGFMRQLSRRLTFDLSTDYSTNQQEGFSTINYSSGSVQTKFEYQLTRGMAFVISHAYVTTFGDLALGGSNRNTVTSGFVYRFGE